MRSWLTEHQCLVKKWVQCLGQLSPSALWTMRHAFDEKLTSSPSQTHNQEDNRSLWASTLSEGVYKKELAYICIVEQFYKEKLIEFYRVTIMSNKCQQMRSMSCSKESSLTVHQWNVYKWFPDWQCTNASNQCLQMFSFLTVHQCFNQCLKMFSFLTVHQWNVYKWDPDWQSTNVLLKNESNVLVN